MDYVSCTPYTTRGTLKLSLEPYRETTSGTLSTRTTTSPDAGDGRDTNMHNTQSSKSAGSQRFCEQQSVTVIVDKYTYMYIYIYIYPLIYTTLPNSTWLHHTARRYM